jgi:hypothetical protein
MAFVPRNYDRGRVRSLPLTASATVTKHQHCYMSSGYLAAGSGGENEAEYIALETKTDATAVDGSTLADVLPISDDIEFDALCQDTPVQATHVGNDYDFQSAAQLDLDATTDKVFHIDSIVNASDKIVRGHFNKPALA